MVTNTAKSFLDKWEHNRKLAFDATLKEGSEISQWILNRNGFADVNALRNYLVGRSRILDAGCGNGRVTVLLRLASDARCTEIMAIDLVAEQVAGENLADLPNVSVRQADMLQSLTGLGTFDFIYCQEVLHHTGNPKRAFGNLVEILRRGGEIAVYVYKKKAPSREFADDYVRNRISSLSYEEAMKICREITELGRRLSEMHVMVRVPTIEVLEIKDGEYDLQRFLYHFFLKCFWNADLTFEENAAVNYDWYHPQDASRHTVEEVRGWFEERKLQIVHQNIDEYGITMRGRRS